MQAFYYTDDYQIQPKTDRTCKTVTKQRNEIGSTTLAKTEKKSDVWL